MQEKTTQKDPKQQSAFEKNQAHTKTTAEAAERGLEAQRREALGSKTQKDGKSAAEGKAPKGTIGATCGRPPHDKDASQTSAPVVASPDVGQAVPQHPEEADQTVQQLATSPGQKAADAAAHKVGRIADVPVEVDKTLTKQGKRGCAVCGTKILIASEELRHDNKFMRHEEVHCLQQQLGKSPQTQQDGANAKAPTNDHVLLENEANDLAQKAVAGSLLATELTVTPTTEERLYQDSNLCADQGEQSVDELVEWVCQAACKCLEQTLKSGQTYQHCLCQMIKAAHYENGYPKAGAQIWCEVPFDRASGWNMIGSKHDPNVPTSNYIRPNSRRPDIVLRNALGKIIKMIEVKFPEDRTGKGNMEPQTLRDYRNAAKRHTGDRRNLQIIDVDDYCQCAQRRPARKPEPVQVPKAEKDLKALSGTNTKQLTAEGSLSWGEVLGEVLLFALQAIVARHPILRLQGDTAPKQLPRNDHE